MSGLLDVLLAQQKGICRALADKLSGADCPTLLRTRTCTPTVIFKALCDACTQGTTTPLRAWVDTLAEDEQIQGAVPPQEALAALLSIERVARYYVIKATAQKKEMVHYLTELSNMIQSMRLRCLKYSAGGAVGDNELYGLVGLADGSSDYICLATLQGDLLYLNAAGRRALGLSEDMDLPPKSLHRCYSRQSWEQLRDVVVPAVTHNGRWEGALRLRHIRTGKPIDVDTTVVHVASPGDAGQACLAISHREIAGGPVAAALAEAQARKNAILESSLDPIITINHEGVITEFNRAAEQAFGYPRAKVLGTKPSDVLFPPDKSEGHQNRIDRYLAAGEGSMLGRRAEVTAVRANGETFPAEMAMTISQEQGCPVMTFFVRDISGRKKAEEAKARHAAELERSNRELEQFAYVASHDLQEPLRKIRTFGDRLEMRCGQMLDDTGRDCVQRMQSAAARMQLLIEGLLSLSRVATRGQDFEPVNLAEVVQEVVTDLEVKLGEVEGRVEVGKLPTIQADRLQMRQLFQNLIGNALKFHRDGEPPVVRIEGGFVRGSKRGEPGQASLRDPCLIVVRDNGIGFEQKHVERIFDVFQRLHPREVYEGTGIGLAICRKIAERHGGSITARSAPGQGATFEILLPAVHPKNE